MKARKKSWSRLLSLSLAGALALSSFTAGTSVLAEESALQASFQDIGASYAKNEIIALAEQGIISGFSAKEFKPTESVTRAQFAKIMVKAMKLEPDVSAAAAFKDVPENQWYTGYVGTLVKAGIAQGTSAETFAPNKTVTREELAVFFVRAFGWDQQESPATTDKPALADLAQVSDWAQPAVELAYHSGFIKGAVQKDGTVQFLPTKVADRQALARLTYEYTFNPSAYVASEKPAEEQAPDTTSEQTTGTTAPAGGGGSSTSKDRDKDKGTGNNGNGTDNGNGSGNGNGNGGTSSKQITAPGTYTLGNVSGNVSITSADVVLKNTTIQGDLTLQSSIGNGDVTLESVTVTGKTNILGGGANSIHIQKSVLATLFVNKSDGSIRLVVEDGSNVQQVEFQSGGKIENRGSTVGPVDILENVPHNAQVVLSGSFDNVLVHAAQARIELAEQSSVGNLQIFEQAINASFNLKQGSTIARAVVNAVVEFIGEGTLSSALVQVDGVSFDQLSQPPVIEADPTVTSVVYAPEQVTLSNLQSQRQVIMTGITGAANKDLTNRAEWSIADTSIAVVNPEGFVTAKGVGTTELHGKYGNHEITIPVNVSVSVYQSVYEDTYGVPYPYMDWIAVTNGEITAVFSDNVDVEQLSIDDLVITAYVDGQVHQLENLKLNSNGFNMATISFDPVNEYGGTLYVTVESVGDKAKFSGSQSGNIPLTGFGGQIKDVDGNPVGLDIKIRQGLGNKTGKIVFQTMTDENGRYYVNLAPGIYTVELGGEGTPYITTYLTGVAAINVKNTNENYTVIKVPEANETRIVLTWGRDPRDLDSHLIGPAVGEGQFHTYFSDKVYKHNGSLIVDLDLDDVTSYGPETTSIRRSVPGEYTFYIHHFAGLSTIRNSDSKVEVFRGNVASPTEVYNVAPGSGNEIYWIVFKMLVAEDGTATFQTINEFTNTNPAKGSYVNYTAD